MPVESDLGKQGPHPDLTTALAARLHEVLPQALPAYGAGEVRASDIRILQQRTLHGLTWENLWGGGWAHDSDVQEVDLSIGLAIAQVGSHERLVMYQAYQWPGKKWGIARLSHNVIEDRPKKPWTGFVKLTRGLEMAWGLITHTTDLASVRISLADGYVGESLVTGGSALLFVPFSSAELWSSTVVFGYYDDQGQEILTGDYPLPPAHMPLSS